jgi:RNA polymerase sigma-70 factor (ECF subfamily)
MNAPFANGPEDLAGYSGGVYRFILLLTQDREIAEEITQETFKVAVSKGPDPEKGTHYGAWLRAIAKNLLRNYRRKQLARWVIANTELVDLAEDRLSQTGADRDDVWDARKSALLSCIQRLSEENRRLLLRRYQLGQTVNYIALDIGLEPNTSSKRLERIRLALRDCIVLALKGRSNG